MQNKSTESSEYGALCTHNHCICNWCQHVSSCHTHRNRDRDRDRDGDGVQPSVCGWHPPVLHDRRNVSGDGCPSGVRHNAPGTGSVLVCIGPLHDNLVNVNNKLDVVNCADLYLVFSSLLLSFSPPSLLSFSPTLSLPRSTLPSPILPFHLHSPSRHSLKLLILFFIRLRTWMPPLWKFPFFQAPAVSKRSLLVLYFLSNLLRSQLSLRQDQITS